MAAILEVKNLVKKYGDFAAVKGVSFDIQEGEIFSLLGPNGAGKTTTTRRGTYLLGTILGQVGTATVPRSSTERRPDSANYLGNARHAWYRPARPGAGSGLAHCGSIVGLCGSLLRGRYLALPV